MNYYSYLSKCKLLFFVALWLIDSFKKTKEVFGQINIVCNNAGISSKNEEQEEEWDKEVDVNLVGRIGNLLWFITLLGLFLFLQILFLNLRFLSDFSYRTFLITVPFNRTDRLSCINICIIIIVIVIVIIIIIIIIIIVYYY